MNKSKLGIVAALLAGTALMAAGFGNTRNSYNTTNNYITQQQTSVYNADNTYNESQLRSAMTASNSVELNPDHEGWSVGGGLSTASANYAGAVGVMYSQEIGGTEDVVKNIGYNVKAYQAEGGYNGVGVGITIGF